MARALDEQGKLVLEELSRARVEFVGADGIMVSGFEEVGKDKAGKPKFRYQEWWLRYADAVDPPDSEREAMTVLAAEVVRLRELVQRARDMIDLSPDSPPWTWPSTEQIDQLVRDCDAVIKNG
jgi:hypothetical protein